MLFLSIVEDPPLRPAETTISPGYSAAGANSHDIRRLLGRRPNLARAAILYVTPDTAQRYAISPVTITYGNAATGVATLRQRYHAGATAWVTASA